MSRASALTFLRWTLLCVLAWGVLAMHHVGAPEGGHAGGHVAHAMGSTHSLGPVVPETGPDNQRLPGGLEGLLHLCMAVVCAAVGLVLLLRALDAGYVRLSPARDRGEARQVARPPPRWGRGILHTVCVLRV